LRARREHVTPSVVAEPGTAEALLRRCERDDFGVRGRALLRNDEIDARGDDVAVGVKDRGAEGATGPLFDVAPREPDRERNAEASGSPWSAPSRDACFVSGAASCS
jgi:hypothetical protein